MSINIYLVFDGTPHEVGNNVTLAVVNHDQNEIQTAFDTLKEEGSVKMDLQETFWSPCYGQVIDKFGIHWQLSLERSETN